MTRDLLKRSAAFGFVGAGVWLCLKSSPEAAFVVGDYTLASITLMVATVVVASIVGTFRGD